MVRLNLHVGRSKTRNIQKREGKKEGKREGKEGGKRGGERKRGGKAGTKERVRGGCGEERKETRRKEQHTMWFITLFVYFIRLILTGANV